jgi:hypothetical protein
MAAHERKRCTTCGRRKSLDEFHRTRRTADGRHGQCKECVRAYDRIRRSGHAYKEAEKVYMRTRRAEDPGAYNAYRRDYYHRQRAQKLVEGGKLLRVRWRGRKWTCGHLTRQHDQWDRGEKAMTMCGRTIPYSDRVEFENGSSFPITCKACQTACMIMLRSAP